MLVPRMHVRRCHGPRLPSPNCHSILAVAAIEANDGCEQGSNCEPGTKQPTAYPVWQLDRLVVTKVGRLRERFVIAGSRPSLCVPLGEGGKPAGCRPRLLLNSGCNWEDQKQSRTPTMETVSKGRPLPGVLSGSPVLASLEGAALVFLLMADGPSQSVHGSVLGYVRGAHC